MTVHVYTNRYYGASKIEEDSSDNNRTDLIPILDSCLVDGFGLQELTNLEHVDNVAVATCTFPHGFEFSTCRVLISGCDQAEYNGEHQITVIDSYSYSYVISGSPISPATSTTLIEMKVAPAGWIKAFGTGLTERMYQQGGGNGFFLNVVDGFNDSYANVKGFEQATSPTAGIDQFPHSTNCRMFKTHLQTGFLNNPWILVASDTFIMWFPYSGGINLSTAPYLGVLNSSDNPSFYFGDFDTVDPSQTHNCALLAGATNNDGQNCDALSYLGRTSGRYTARGVDNITKTLPVMINYDCNNTGYIGDHQNDASAVQEHPNPLTGKLDLGRISLVSGTSDEDYRIGRLRNVYGCMQHVSYFQSTELKGLSGMGDKILIVVGCHNDANLFIEISN